MNVIQCFDVLMMVIDDANNQFGISENREKVSQFKLVCRNVDNFVDEVGGESIEVEVDEVTKDIFISVFCNDLVVEDDRRCFELVASMSKKTCFKKSYDDNLLRIEFVFDGVWDD